MHENFKKSKELTKEKTLPLVSDDGTRNVSDNDNFYLSDETHERNAFFIFITYLNQFNKEVRQRNFADNVKEQTFICA